MFLERLSDYFGTCGAEEAAWIEKRIGNYTEEAQEKLFEVLTSENSKRYGFPDISKLTKAFASVRPDGEEGKPKCIWWLKCNVCGCEYWGDLAACPSCHTRGKKERSAGVVKAQFLPDFTKEVVRFNKPWRLSTSADTSCYDCDSRAGSFCFFFGDPKYDCNKRTVCHCNTCCMRAMERIKND